MKPIRGGGRASLGLCRCGSARLGRVARLAFHPITVGGQRCPPHIHPEEVGARIAAPSTDLRALEAEGQMRDE